MKNRVLQTQKEYNLGQGMIIPKGQEIEIVQDVVYINGFPVMQPLQGVFINFINKNEKELIDVTRNW